MKRAIVTGASGNLGKAVVEQLLGRGYQVSGTGYLPGSGAGYTGTKLNLKDEAATAEWVHSVIQQGTVHTAVLTVGGFAMGDIASTSSGSIQEQINLNFMTAYHVAKPVFLHMKEQGSGTIFLIGSQAGMATDKNKGVTAYGLSKSLLFRLADLMNLEAAGTAVKVFVVVPFILDTPQNRVAMPDADRLGWQTPGQIAANIYIYANDPLGKVPLMTF
ncbi:MAG TPA: SDR family NAD(P)-dependent oxidoreductase [Chitinophagaceae bacterium]|nr:SDR family NAD(P)-dependent oxidoreductase [Chitinophagaceae bacterium]